MEPIADVVARGMASGLTVVERNVFGTADAERIALLLERFCARHLGTPPIGGHFYGSSVGCVIGLALESGHDVVVKAYQRRWRAPFLSAVQDVQRAVADGGLPCPRPLAPPAPLTPLTPDLGTIAMVESWLPDPGMRVLGSPRERRVSAGGLARQISLCDDLSPAVCTTLRDHPLRTPAGALYTEPHSPLFDFAATSGGAQWIDAIAARAAAARDADTTRFVVGHTDWSARNVRFDEERLLAVYDWDSAACVAESTAVGQAAITWRVTAEPGASAFPTADEVAAYVRDYEEAVGRALTEQQWAAAGAAAAFTLAYTARCEHALEASGIDRADPRAARDRLADSAERLLALVPPLH